MSYLGIRTAAAEDEPALLEIDRRTWSAESSPQVEPSEASVPFFAGSSPLADVLVADLDGELVGYVKLGPPTPLRANRHVLEVQGLAVLGPHRGQGIAKRLLRTAIGQAELGGIRRLRLRVLAVNTVARRLYESLGFEVEGVLREEFLIDGRYFDDVLMALVLA